MAVSELMRLFKTIFNMQSIVIVDEYNTPFMSMLHNSRFNESERKNIFDIYMHLLSSILKGNDYLHKSILVSVFNICDVGLGSGFSNVEVYMTHSGLSGISHVPNPFEHAFDFTVSDVWGLINKFVDKQWQCRKS
ncbi:hypothetical protein IWW42_005859, partial [Coemansia sp. RSA 1085]